MNKRPVISLVLNAHAPFVRHPEFPCSPENPGSPSEGRVLFSAEERWFFDTLAETWIPLLRIFDRLDRDRIPFRLGISLSPTLSHMLGDELLLSRYLEYTDRQIEFGAREIERKDGGKEYRKLAEHYYDALVEKRILFTERYGGNLLKVLDYYQKKCRIEILTTSATHAFLPFYTAFPEAIQAQLEVAIGSFRLNFGKYPQGFWLPELGWSAELDRFLRSYNFVYTIVDTHALILGQPPAERGSFCPVKTPAGVFILGRDFYAVEEIDEMVKDPLFRDNNRDLGYELPAELVQPFLGPNGIRTPTGYKYWAAGEGGTAQTLYDPALASCKVREQARAFLASRISRLKAAGELMNGVPAAAGASAEFLQEASSSSVSLCAFNADRFGRFWHEGPEFIETLFREGAKSGEFQFMTPSEYLCKQESFSFQPMVPEFSSAGTNGYAEMWLDASNDWMYRHSMRALERMIEIADRFPDNSGLKERTLNQAAREILLVQSSDWARMLYKQESAEYARNQIESCLRNFTTIYEALGSNYISTEWLTNLERRHNIFPQINYRIFRKKK